MVSYVDVVFVLLIVITYLTRSNLRKKGYFVSPVERTLSLAVQKECQETETHGHIATEVRKQKAVRK